MVFSRTDNLDMGPATAARLAELHAEIAEIYRGLALADPTADSERMLGLREAVERLGCTESWLCRRANWQKVGGFKGPDGRVKFPLSALSAYANDQKH
jgi:hypothetical protein